jgi:hypothetical protein
VEGTNPGSSGGVLLHFREFRDVPKFVSGDAWYRSEDDRRWNFDIVWPRGSCALAFGTASNQIGLPLRSGLHTGEIEIRGHDIGGIAVHAAARVMSQSQASEVLVSRVVTDLVDGAGLKFFERGSHEGPPGSMGFICCKHIVHAFNWHI